MNLQGWIYVANKEYGTVEAALMALRELEAKLEAKVDADSIAGFTIVALAEPDDFVEYDINRVQVESVTHGRLPTMRLNITYDLDIHRVDQPDVGELLAAEDMVRVYPADPTRSPT
ncbi:hypothetical protein ACFQ1S_44655 [Kibdelosporangium lantanae]|uniref:Uncharacterized protein n=1 Tax=Kibdelosporangium lantanae TaxID=1497396 RepID=A0ABW3MNI0_9PSEU